MPSDQIWITDKINITTSEQLKFRVKSDRGRSDFNSKKILLLHGLTVPV